MITKITQSFMKDYQEYEDGIECGNIIREKYVNGRMLSDPDEHEETETKIDWMNLGSYFEFVAFGTLPKNGLPPQPEMMASGKDMLAPYRLAKLNALRVKKYFEEMGWIVIPGGNGKKLTKGRFEGTLDLIVECTKNIKVNEHLTWQIGDRLVIDLKYSGFVGARAGGQYKNKHGWVWSPVQKKYHGTQAKQYHFVSGGLPFYFLVTSSKNDKDIDLFYVPVSEFMIEQHIAQGNFLFDKFEAVAMVGGFEPRPSLKKCLRCPLREECMDKHTFPYPEIVNLEED